MFGIGFGELIIIFIVALLVVGPHKLPEMAKNLAKVLREVRKTSDEFQASIFRETGPSVSGLLKSPEATIKRHLENEVQEALGLEEDCGEGESPMASAQSAEPQAADPNGSASPEDVPERVARGAFHGEQKDGSSGG
ncbi:MAG: twin-arginine translocase subunit TatB [Myxococcales bacterium]|nr:twin-arginine translocase subunit TatB [Myxococcales bacterium]|tara:strand:+ start:1103 stop:1513 length:411 start_codon:yes stop_codon:yes gene_type:complete